MAYPVSIGDFEGPLDLLLHLISTQKIDIYDISIFEVTEQYLAYIYQWQEMNLEIAGEFIVMASRLLEIKSFVLLPASSDDSETGESLKQALMEQLLAYQVFKRIGVYLKEQEEKHLGQVYREPTYFPEMEKRPCLPIEGEVLREAFTKVLAMERLKEPLKPVSAKIEREIFKIEDKIALLEKKLAFKGKEPVLFSELLTENGGKAEAIVSFQALLEYHKKGTITFKQTGLFQEIMVCQCT